MAVLEDGEPAMADKTGRSVLRSAFAQRRRKTAALAGQARTVTDLTLTLSPSPEAVSNCIDWPVSWISKESWQSGQIVCMRTIPTAGIGSKSRILATVRRKAGGICSSGRISFFRAIAESTCLPDRALILPECTRKLFLSHPVLPQ